jgi:hypothetical protein
MSDLVGKTIAAVEETEMAGRDTYKDTVSWTATTITFTDGTKMCFAASDGEVYGAYEITGFDDEGRPIPKMYARLTDQGTAICETAVCAECLASVGNAAIEDLNAPDATGEHVDCSGNEALECQLCGWGGKPEPREVRASELSVGDRFAEDGMDPATIAKRGDHGDTVLIWTEDGSEISLDIDTVVTLNPEED